MKILNITNIISGIISSLLSNLIWTYFTSKFNNIPFDLNTYLMLLQQYWYVWLLIFISTIIIKVQRSRMSYNPIIYQSIPSFKIVGFSYIEYYGFLWQINVQDKGFTYDSPLFNYNITGPFCPEYKNEICLTPLKMKNYYLFSYLNCVNCNKSYILFKSKNSIIKDMQLKLHPQIIKNNIITAEEFMKFLKSYEF